MLEKSNVHATDMVVFMTACHFSKVSIRKKKLLPRKKDMKTEMKKQHIEAILSNDAVISQLDRMDFKFSFNKLSQDTTISFSEEKLAKESHDDIFNQMNWAFKMKKEMAALFDDDILKPSLFFELEPFLY